MVYWNKRSFYLNIIYHYRRWRKEIKINKKREKWGIEKKRKEKKRKEKKGIESSCKIEKEGKSNRIKNLKIKIKTDIKIKTKIKMKINKNNQFILTSVRRKFFF